MAELKIPKGNWLLVTGVILVLLGVGSMIAPAIAGNAVVYLIGGLLLITVDGGLAGRILATKTSESDSWRNRDRGGNCSDGPSILWIGCARACLGVFLCRRRCLEDLLLVFLPTGAWLDCVIDEWVVGFHSGNTYLAAMAGFRFVGSWNISWRQLVIDWHGLRCPRDDLETLRSCREKQNRSCQREACGQARGIGSLICRLDLCRRSVSSLHQLRLVH
jgi:hypothetical protein